MEKVQRQESIFVNQNESLICSAISGMYSLDAQLFYGLPVAVVEVVMEDLGQPHIVGLKPLHI